MCLFIHLLTDAAAASGLGVIMNKGSPYKLRCLLRQTCVQAPGDCLEAERPLWPLVPALYASPAQGGRKRRDYGHEKTSGANGCALSVTPAMVLWV